MRFKQLNIEVHHNFWIEPFDNKGLNFTPGDIGQLRLSSATGKLQLIIKNKLFTISLDESMLLNEIEIEFRRGNANLVEISRVYQQKDWPQNIVKLELSLTIFNGPEIDLGNIDIALDPRTMEQAKVAGLGDNFKDIKIELEHRCRLMCTDDLEQQYAIMIMGESALDQLHQLHRLEKSVNIIDATHQKEIKNGLVLLGDNLQIAVQQYSAVEYDYLGVRKLVIRSHTAPTRTLRLVRVKLSFSDQQQQIALLASQQLGKIIADQKGYLSAWDKYGESEGEELLKRAREVGRIIISPDDCKITGDGGNQTKIYIDKDLRDILTSQDSIQLVNIDMPVPYLDDLDMDWKTFSEQMLTDYKEKKGYDSGLSSWSDSLDLENENTNNQVSAKCTDNESSQYLKIIKVDHKYLVVEGIIQPSTNMVIIQSILGDQVQVERRMAARNAIIEGKSAMPHLGLLIEEGAILPTTRAQRSAIEPLTSFVESKIFPKNPPTETQKRAIKIALNTPDIAIIQGPPGTGKTTVITAIIERLNQELDKNRSIQGDILISGYQHDAVENLLSRLSVNDLPAIKFGQRSDEIEQSSLTDIKLDEWRLSTVKRIYQQSPELKEGVDYLQLERDAQAYAAKPSDSAALRLVKKAKVLLTGIPHSDEVITLLDGLSNDLRSQELVESDVIYLLRSLRLSKAAFMDDGVNRIAALIAWFEAQNISIQDTYLNILKKAMTWQPGEEMNFLSELKKVKFTLLKQFVPRPQLQRVLSREDVKLAIQKSLNLLQNSRYQHKNRTLIEYVSDLEGNPALVQEALSEYNLVYGATTGQSEGREIRRFKSKSGDGKGYLQYSTVIIDEAARASPRDLMIPMIQAKDRIILVGDHRQLPHIVDDSLLEKMEKEMEVINSKEGGGRFNEQIKKSMFEYLFHRAKQLESQDGQCRTITLDAQYRSHPLLGKFASEQFYAPHNEGYKSPLPANFFSQNLVGIENKAAVWIDVPSQSGKEERNESKSRYRIAEAEIIARYLKQWIDSDEGKNLSFGVISFYKAQVDKVMHALAKYHITERDEQGDYVIAKKYQMLFDDDGNVIEERIRIGTVDAFQGMEFDIVFLSMVRTQPSNSKFFEERDFSPHEQQRVFGHLMSKSRLCVSVTRQKRVLVLVGDSDLIQTSIAKQAVPELQAFYNLCVTNSQGALFI